MALTPAGAIWLDHARRVLSDAEALPAIAQRAARGELGRLRLAFVSTASYSVLPDLVRRFRDAFPDVRVDLREATSDIQLAALAKGEIDAGIIIPSGEGFRTAGLSHRPLQREPLVAVVPADFSFPGTESDRSVPFDRIAAEPLILFPRHVAPAYYDIVADFYARNGQPLHIHQEAIQMQTIIGLVAAGLGVSLVPASMTALNRNGARYLPIEGAPPHIETCIVWRDAEEQPALRSFLTLMDGVVA